MCVWDPWFSASGALMVSARLNSVPACFQYNPEHPEEGEAVSKAPKMPLRYVCLVREGAHQPVSGEGHGPWCDFVLNPTLHPTGVGNITPPDVDWLLRNIFNVKEPHSVITSNINEGIVVPMSDIAQTLMRILIDPTQTPVFEAIRSPPRLRPRLVKSGSDTFFSFEE